MSCLVYVQIGVSGALDLSDAVDFTITSFIKLYHDYHCFQEAFGVD